MTRKRYIKLLMAKGLSRNAANAFAELGPGKTSYEEAYDLTLIPYSIINPKVKLKRINTQEIRFGNIVFKTMSDTTYFEVNKETDDEKTQAQTIAGD